MQQLKPEYRSIEESGVSEEEILRSMNLASEDLLPGSKMQVVNTGNAFLVVPLKNQNALAAITPNQNEIYWLSEKLNVIGFYPFALLEQNSTRQATSRMFAPRFGVPEESATGTAAGPLAGYLYDYIGLKLPRFRFEQGHWMKHPSPSLIEVQLILEANQISGMMVGGSAILAGKKHLTW
jgi:PhzF family phenazine biosynthesis protein